MSSTCCVLSCAGLKPSTSTLGAGLTQGVVLQGVVAFLPSFAFAEQAERRWKASGGLQALAALKQVFWEPREASQLEPVLHAYTLAALSAWNAELSADCIPAGLTQVVLCRPCR